VLQLRKEALDGAIQNVDIMHEMATTQKDLLEEAAFVSVSIDRVLALLCFCISADCADNIHHCLHTLDATAK
jgi:hypothetical protein